MHQPKTPRPFMAAKPVEGGVGTPIKRRKQPGRPSDYTEEIGAQICEQIADGVLLNDICEQKGMPSRQTIARWAIRYPQFRELYTTARQVSADWFAEQAVRIANDSSRDMTTDASGKTIPVWEAPQRSRLRCDMIRWYCAKIAPKRYSDKVVNELTGADGGAVKMQTMPMMPDEIADELNKKLGEMEEEMGWPVNESATPQQRIHAMLSSGQPIPADLYDAISRAKQNGNA